MRRPQHAAEGDAALRQSLPASDSRPRRPPARRRRRAPPARRQAAAGEKLVAKQVFVKIGRRQGNLIEIVEGLKAGQTVVTSGQNKLSNNAPVDHQQRRRPGEARRRTAETAPS